MYPACQKSPASVCRNVSAWADSERSGEHLNGLSRQGLFNVPRWGKVEGMRPLGRLAFVDHQDLIRTQLEKAIDRAFKTDPVEAWKSASQPLFSLDAIDIVFVGSISGGPCSESLMDAAWMLRSILAARRLPTCCLSTMLIHGNDSRQ